MLDQIKKGLIANSYALINDVTVTNKQHAFHVPCNHAEVRQIFMHLRGKAVLIEITETSHDCGGKSNQYWSIKFHFGYLPLSKLNRMCFNEEKFMNRDLSRWDDCQALDHYDNIIPGHNKEFQIPKPFIRLGGIHSYLRLGSLHPDRYMEHSFPIETSGKPCSYHDCITAIVTIVDQVKPYLAKLFDRRSSMRCHFAPTYVFPGCDDTFNKQFQEEALYFHQLFTPHRNQKPQNVFKKFLDFDDPDTPGWQPN